MQLSKREFAESYRNSPDVEIAALHAQIDTLTDVARVALIEEIERRGLGEAALGKLHAAELRNEARFDRLEETRRKKTAMYLLARGDPKGTILVIAIFLVLVLLSVLFAHR
jgi:hypothetical protein